MGQKKKVISRTFLDATSFRSSEAEAMLECWDGGGVLYCWRVLRAERIEVEVDERYSNAYGERSYSRKSTSGSFSLAVASSLDLARARAAWPLPPA